MNSSIKITNTMCSREDRISSLLDSILIHILSFLPTKFVVRTSILSTRWRYTWTSIPVLDFCDRLYSWIEPNAREKSHFMNFVERVLPFHHGSNVHKFSLSCSTTDLFRVHSWISSTIIKHRVEELKLKIFNSGTSSFPLSPGIFSCKSLIKLTIQVQRVVIPSSVCMSSLKSLIFSNTMFSCEGLAPPVYFRFPNLDNFSVEYCEWENIESVYVFVPKLKRLTIYEDDLELEVGIPVNFYAENLKSFEFCGIRFNKYPVCNLSSVINASIDVSRDNDIDALGVNSFLGRFSNVKDLTVACQVINTLSHADNLSHLLKFPNLTNLKLTSLYNFSCEDFLRFLHMLPNLESLMFTDELDPFIYNEDNPIHNTVPQCFVTHLKAIEFPFLLGNESELFLIKLLLKKVSVLERMTIKSSFGLLNDVKKQMEITKNLLMLPRASACMISFS